MGNRTLGRPAAAIAVSLLVIAAGAIVLLHDPAEEAPEPSRAAVEAGGLQSWGALAAPFVAPEAGPGSLLAPDDEPGAGESIGSAGVPEGGQPEGSVAGRDADRDAAEDAMGDRVPPRLRPAVPSPSDVGAHEPSHDVIGGESPGVESTGPVPLLGELPSGGAQTAVQSSDSVVLAPVYRRTRTFFGTALSSSDGSIDAALATNDALFGWLPIVRQFDPGLPPPGAWSRRTALHDRMIVFSFRTSPAEVIRGTYDAEIKRFFREAPTRKPIFYSFWHEPEPDINAGSFTASEYRAAFRRVVRLVSSLKKKNLYPTLILTGWTADPASKRNWRDYHPGDEFISVLAWDPYNGAHGNPERYKEPEEVFGHVARVSRSARKPWGIAETGTALVTGDKGQGRAVWLRRSGEYLEGQGASFVTYFQSTRDGDFKLDDQHSVRAWSQHVRRSTQ